MVRLTDEQNLLLEKAVEWFHHSSEQVFQFTGLPGTGKSFMLNNIIKRLGLDPLTQVAAMSYIGAASLVMRMKGLTSAKTIHSWLYNVVPKPLKNNDGEIIYDDLFNVPIMIPKFIPINKLDKNIKLIVVDEGFTTPIELKQQIEKFGIKIIVCGDPMQLPPVNSQPAYLVNGNIYRLTKRMRQIGCEDIAKISDLVANGIEPLNGYYGNSLVINKCHLTDDMLMWADCIICSKNNTRDAINDRIRAILGYQDSKLPRYGEKIICRKNNWLESIQFDNGTDVCLVNGLTGRVINNPDVSSFDGKLFSLSFVPDLCNSVEFKNIRCNYKHMISNNDIRLKIRNNRFEGGNMFEYAYAITTHCSQGQQFHKVIYIEEYMKPDLQRRLNFVGASRADQSLIYVKP